ncbi:MAG: hypothetical protein KAX44_03745 [Candidatus Brocadiae bacterium]|nr:hypothetical protein [Candidatus Brocadiia bacterium]
MLWRMKLPLVLVAVPVLLAAAGHGWETATMVSELPEGDGLAAKYPGDRGIEDDPAVVFADDFETADLGRVPSGYHKGGNSKWDNTWGGCLITEQAEGVHSGKKAVEMTVVQTGSGPGGGLALEKFFEKGFDTLFLRYYAKFEKNTELYHGGAHNGGRIAAVAPGAPPTSPGLRPDGSNQFILRLDSWRTREEVPSPGYLVVYVYHMDQGGRWGDQFFPSGKVFPPDRQLFGDEFVPRPEFIPERDRWYCYEFMLQANTPGERDGRVAFWVDGKLVGDFPNIRFRNVATLKPDRVQIALYTQNRRVRKDVTMWYDDVVAATSYIGPQVPAE